MIPQFSRNMMLSFSGALLTSMLLTGQAQAQATESAEADSSATIIAPIALNKASDLLFGTVIRSAEGTNTVSIDADTGARTISGSGNSALVQSSTSRATYSVAGEAGATFSIDVDEDVTLVSGSDSLVVTLLSSASSGTLTGGSTSFGVGGSFELSDATATGAYEGSFNVTVAYD